jgi:hypothetical protein
MRKLFDLVVRWLRHPRLTLASNLWFVIGAGILGAGLLGGALAVLTSFPLEWLIVTAAGAFLFVLGGTNMAVRARGWQKLGAEPPDPGEDHNRQELRQAVGRILAELENARGAIERASFEEEWWLVPLQTQDWSRSADTLMRAGLDKAHKATRIAYRHITELNSLAKETHEAAVDHLTIVGADVPAGIRPSADGNDAVFREAVTAIRRAEAELEKAQDI